SPELSLTLSSDQMNFEHFSLQEVELKFSSKNINNSLRGNVKLSFKKEEIPYTFSGNAFWDDVLGLIPNRITAKTDLNELSQLFEVDDGSTSGNVNFELTYSNEELRGEVTINNGAFESYFFGSEIKNIEAVLEITP